MKNQYLPVFQINSPNSGLQAPPPPITPTTPIYSSYTSKFVKNGNVSYNTPNDAPPGNAKFGGVYHVIVYNQENKTYMMHGGGK